MEDAIWKNKKKENKKPLNILYIMADDHAYQAVSAYGSQVSKLAPTPNIDRIANEGARMDAVYCTNSICGPSRASILTGKLSHVNGFYKNVDGGDFNGDQLTFPKFFKKMDTKLQLLENGIWVLHLQALTIQSLNKLGWSRYIF